MVLLATLTAVGLATPTGRAHADTTVDATAGVNGFADPLRPVVVSVRVSADELVDGHVEVSQDGSATVVRQELQVPAGTTKDVQLLVPGPFFAGTLQIDVRDGDRLVATRDLRVRAEDDVELVGVLPRLLARGQELPDQVTLASGTGRAELAALPLDVLDLGPGALEAYDTIAGTSDDVAAIDAEQRSSLLLWVNTGGRLLLDDAAAIDTLPAAWRPGPAGYAWAGVGEVRVVDGAASRGEWGAIVEPSAVAVSDMFAGEIFVDPEADLARRSGLRLPSLTPIVVTLAIYGLVIGPVVYLLLRRARRLTLGWVVIPIVAVLTTGGIVAAGGRYRSGGNPATSTFVDLSPGGSQALTTVLAFERSGGTTTVSAPAGWTVDDTVAMWNGRRGDGPRALTASPDGVALTMSLEAGQVATETMTGPTATADFAVSATMRPDGELGGTVVNGTAAALRDVAVFVGPRAVRVGDLAAGATAEWSTPAPDRLERFVSRADQVWSMPFEPGSQSQRAELGIWGAASLRFDLFAPGLVRAVGWADDIDPTLDIGRDASTRTALSATAPVDAAGEPLGAATVRAALVRTPFGQFGDGTGDLVYRYVLPPGAAGDGLQLTDVDNLITDVAVWDGTGWIDLDDGAGDALTVPVPAVRGGTLLVRAVVDGRGDPESIPALEAAG
jgi:hypothetical protein